MIVAHNTPGSSWPAAMRCGGPGGADLPVTWLVLSEFRYCRHNDAICLMLGNCPCAIAGVAGVLPAPTLDKIMGDRKPLVPAEVDKLLAATKDSWNEAHDRTPSLRADFSPLC